MGKKKEMKSENAGYEIQIDHSEVTKETATRGQLMLLPYESLCRWSQSNSVKVNPRHG
jgi:hypothetical protein